MNRPSTIERHYPPCLFPLRCVFFGVLIFLLQVPEVASSADLQTLRNCTFVETAWSDGDSFLVKDQQGKQFTIRLYGVDCLEYHVHDETDARRLRAQRRYFGISEHGGSSANSIAAAKEFGKEAAIAIKKELKNPFTVHTAFADGRGDGKHKRYYGFVTTSNNEDLGEKLVKLGLARAFGVYRQTPDGRTRDEYREWLKDMELQAAIRGNGIWTATDWKSLPAERRKDREENAELALATKTQPLDSNVKINLNAAARDELMRLPGIGEVIANRIIEQRPFKSIDSLFKVDGIGPKTLEQIKPNLTVDE